MEKKQEKTEDKISKKKPKKLYIILSVVFILLSILFLFIGRIDAALGPIFLAIFLILYVKKINEDS